MHIAVSKVNLKYNTVYFVKAGQILHSVYTYFSIQSKF